MFYFLLIPVAFLIYFASVESISLVTADLGRHITNGKLILEALFNGQDLYTTTPLFTNFYSYTIPSQEAMNHHWLSGVVFYQLYQFFGFDGLEIINVLLIIVANLIFFFAAKELSNKNIALLALVLAIPITCMRREVRPESFSYVFMAINFLLLALFQKQKISRKYLFMIILPLQMLWINMHLFFIFGLFAIACFALASVFVNRNLAQNYFYLLLSSMAVSLLNPAHILGLIEPLMIFKGYGYMIAENQSVFFMQSRSPLNPQYPYFEILLVLILLTIGFALGKGFKQNLLLLMFLPLMIASLKTNRIMPVTALYAIPLLATAIQAALVSLKDKTRNQVNQALFYLALFLIIFYSCVYFIYFRRDFGKYKYNPAMNYSAEFILQNALPQPVFNNFDIGGYFIFHLFPQYRPFVDNRPEAYQKEFFDNYYNAMLSSDDKWKETEKQFGFQTIYFMRHDATEHAQPFLIRRIQDSSWAPVYVDNWTIILLKRNARNQELIKRLELPAEIFKVVKS